MSDVIIAPWMQTVSGRAVDLLDPRPEQIDLEDMAAALERIPRFNGHTVGRPWMVARHSHLVANLIPHVTDDDDPSLRLAALLHDGHEAYVGDPIAPVKAALVQLLGFDPYKRLVPRLQATIHVQFGLPAELPRDWNKYIKIADLTALHIEKRHLMCAAPRPWVELPPLPRQSKIEIEAVDLYFDNFGNFSDLIKSTLREIAEDA